MAKKSHMMPVLASSTHSVETDRVRGDVASNMAALGTAAITPKVARGYGPRQKAYRAPLTSAHHFGTVAAMTQRREELHQFTLSRAMRHVQRQWGATYTQALFTDTTNAKQSAALREELVKLRAFVDDALNDVPRVKAATKPAKKGTH